MVGTGIYDQAKVLKRTKIVSPDGAELVGWTKIITDSHEGPEMCYQAKHKNELFNNWFIGDFCLVTVPKLVLGGNCQINAGAYILGRETVSIGRGSVVSYGVLILTSSDTPNPPEWKHNDFDPEEDRRIKSAPVTIGCDCFIGAKSVIMPGVVIMDYTAIPAGSYVYMDKKGVLCWRPLGNTVTGGIRAKLR